LRTNGGVSPGGNCFRISCEIDVACAFAVAMLVPGWKKILMTP